MKKIEQIEKRELYLKKQLSQLKNKKKEEKSKEKSKERRLRNHKMILLGSSISKVLNINHQHIDDIMPKIIGLIEGTKRHLDNPEVLKKGMEILDGWNNKGK